jgi:hypothetical protein
VDIDCALYAEEDMTKPLASGNFTFNEQESFVYALQPNKNYVLKVLFWKWDASSVPQCPVFNMEVAVVPTTVATLPQRTCQDPPYHWPPAPASTMNLPADTYHYNSVVRNEPLYYQQTIARTRSPGITFTLNAPANLHAELGYEFISGDLLMRLTNNDTREVYWGVNQLNGNVLNLVEIPQGNYTLHIEEVTPNLGDYMGCSHFTFELQIYPVEPLTSRYHPLPASFDTIPFFTEQQCCS